MAVKFEYPLGATPVDPDDAAGLIPLHITTQGQLNEWEFQNVAEGRAWAFSGKRKQFLTMGFVQELHRRMFSKTWKGYLGSDPREIGWQVQNRVELARLIEVADEFHDRARTRGRRPVARGSP